MMGASRSSTISCSKSRTTIGASQPVQMTGYRGNGGIGIEVEGWVCYECQPAYNRKQTVENVAEELRYLD